MLPNHRGFRALLVRGALPGAVVMTTTLTPPAAPAAADAYHRRGYYSKTLTPKRASRPDVLLLYLLCFTLIAHCNGLN